MKIKRISEIDTSAETFRCRFHIYFTWLASQSECQQWDSLKKGQEFKPKWTPTFAWSNGISLHPTDTGPIAFKIKDGWKAGSVRKGAWNIENDDFGFPPHEGRWIRVKYEYDIEFAEELELIAFPFDVCCFLLILYFCSGHCCFCFFFFVQCVVSKSIIFCS